MARPPTPFEVARSIAEGRLLLAAYEAGLDPPEMPEAFSDDLEAVFDAIVDDSRAGLTWPLNESVLFHRALEAVQQKLLEMLEADDEQS